MLESPRGTILNVVILRISRRQPEPIYILSSAPHAMRMF